MANSPIALISDPDCTLGLPSNTVAIWQAWTRKRAQHAPTLEQVQEITKKVQLNVTQTILEERILMQFSITQTPAHESALQALRMWRSNLTSPKKPMPAREPVLQSDEIEPPPADEQEEEGDDCHTQS